MELHKTQTNTFLVKKHEWKRTQVLNRSFLNTNQASLTHQPSHLLDMPEHSKALI